jgi:hypothetical protein
MACRAPAASREPGGDRCNNDYLPHTPRLIHHAEADSR